MRGEPGPTWGERSVELWAELPTTFHLIDRKSPVSPQVGTSSSHCRTCLQLCQQTATLCGFQRVTAQLQDLSPCSPRHHSLQGSGLWEGWLPEVGPGQPRPQKMDWSWHPGGWWRKRAGTVGTGVFSGVPQTGLLSSMVLPDVPCSCAAGSSLVLCMRHTSLLCPQRRSPPAEPWHFQGNLPKY
jgi:hypothetical protein